MIWSSSHSETLPVDDDLTRSLQLDQAGQVTDRHLRVVRLDGFDERAVLLRFLEVDGYGAQRRVHEAATPMRLAHGDRWDSAVAASAALVSAIGRWLSTAAARAATAE